MDYKRAGQEEGPAPHVTKLWRPRDGGRNWTQLDWPESQRIDQLLFLDPDRGYALGFGPRVWRTADGGRTWKAIKVSPRANADGDPQKSFDGASLGPDGVLRVAYYVPSIAGNPAASIVERLKWDSETFEQDVTLPDQVVVSLESEEVPAVTPIQFTPCPGLDRQTMR